MSDVRFCKIGYHANQINQNATAAYWDDARETFHGGQIRDSFAQLALLLGYTITPIAAASAAKDDEVAA